VSTPHPFPLDDAGFAAGAAGGWLPGGTTRALEGIYVSRNTYIRQGAVELRREKAVHLVTCFRFLRFFPDGSLLYRTSPLTIKQVVKTLTQTL